ncbi:Rv2175c family DNA-binding protein [Leucobacter sp. W1153]|uniref:Rv2175c family DNA-binding protein n=1 Tax=unclassified Leucobacter TaxID=2621730 RepID=UPI003F3520B4
MAESIPLDTVTVTIPELVERWGTTPGKLHRLIEDGYLAAIRIGGVLRIPVEFIQDEEPLHSLRGTLLVLRDAGFTNDEAVTWLLSENEELGERPVAALIDGRKSAVRRATQSLAF